MKSLRQAIRDNQRFCRDVRLLRRIRLRVFQYEDDGKLEKAQRIIERIKVICVPWWTKRAMRLQNKMWEQRTQ